jgi:quinol monooxygenase YgiN
MSQIGATVRITAKDGRADELAAVLDRLHVEVSQEPGCDLYSVVRADREPGSFTIIELYRDRDALKAHQRNERLPPLGAELSEVAASIDIQLGSVTGDRGRRQ